MTQSKRAATALTSQWQVRLIGQGESEQLRMGGLGPSLVSAKQLRLTETRQMPRPAAIAYHLNAYLGPVMTAVVS